MYNIQEDQEKSSGYGIPLSGAFNVIVETEDYFNDENGTTPKEKEESNDAKAEDKDSNPN